MGIARDADGVTRRWATAVGPADLPLPGPTSSSTRCIWQYGTGDRRRRTTPRSAARLHRSWTAAGYRAIVAEAVDAMQAPGRHAAQGRAGPAAHGRAERPAAPAPVLRRLRAAEPTCTIFSLPVPDGTFFGATPELLIARHGRRVTCHPLAGTIPRGDTARTDADAQGGLAALGQGPGRAPLVVDDIAASSRPFCDEPHRARGALAGGLPLGGPPGHADRGAPGRPTTGPRAARAAPPDARRGRHARGPRRWPPSPTASRATAATGPARSAGSTPGATASG